MDLTGAYSEYVVVPAESVARNPNGASLVEASTLPMNGLTARLALDLLALQPGQTLAVTGGAGAFGGYVVQLATAEGLPRDSRCVTGRRGSGQRIRCRGRGPRTDVAERIRALVPDGVDGLADGALLFAQALPAVRDGGGLAVVRTYSGETERGITIHPVWVRSYAREQAKLDRLRQHVEDGVVMLRVAGTFPAEHASEAHRILEAGGTRGRLVIEF